MAAHRHEENHVAERTAGSKEKEMEALMERYRDPDLPYILPFEKHTADSKWQFCNCQSCQEIRFRLDSMPGPKIDYNTYRHKDEPY
jgi:hypothetical protein